MESTSHFGVETRGDYCSIRVCSCGLFYVTIGAVTMKLTAEMFESVADTFTGVVGSRDYTPKLPRVAEAVN